MSNIQLYTCHHKPSSFLDSEIIQPLHVGKSNSFNDIGCAGDNTGDNISFKNPYYCELTAQYWVWKNSNKVDYIGFMHYRRHLNFSDKQDFPEDTWGVVNYPVIDEAYQQQYGLNEQQITACLKDIDILLPKKWDVRSAGSKNNYQHYKLGKFLHIDDYQLAIDVLLKLYPEYYSAVKIFNDSSSGYYTNMFVMRHDIFNHYSEWLFNILTALESEISFSNYNVQEQRVIGHISERLFNIYITHQLTEKNYRVKELQRTFITKETFNGKLLPAFPEKNIPLVISFDNNYSVSGAALVNSIIKNSSIEFNYDVVILENGISTKNKERLLNLTNNLANFSLRFFDINAFSEIKDVFTRAHFSAATYARLFIPKLFSEFDKVVFIDADTVVESDVSELYKLDIKDNLVAAVKDIVMEGFVKFNAMSDSEDGVMPAKKYLQTVLNMTNPDAYFQAGLIVFNVAQMVKENTFAILMNTLKAKSYWFLDQDIMNKVFYDRVHYLPLEWNVYHGNGNTNDFFPNLNFATYMSFLAARKHPKMIHYAGENKPWNTSAVDFFDNYLTYIRDTPWYLDVLQNILKVKSGSHPNTVEVADQILLRTKVKRKLMPTVNKFAPTGTARRSLLIKFYYMVRRIILG